MIGEPRALLPALAHALEDTPGASALACDADGTDGTEDNAGAIMTPLVTGNGCRH